MDKPKIAVYKYSSCAGCQLQFINIESELTDLLGHIHISYFKEATSLEEDPPYDIGFIEGSVTCPHEEEKVKKAREDCKVVVALGACACEGCVNTLKNYHDLNDVVSRVYPHPEYIHTYEQAHGIDHFIKVDAYLHGCPVNRLELRELIVSVLIGKKPYLRPHAVCAECKINENECLIQTEKALCLGSVTRGGCNAVCTTNGRPCFGCRGPNEDANPEALVEIFKRDGHPLDEIKRRFLYFSGDTPVFRKGAEACV
ncbi:MAG: oxidoreductase [Firmicutes bacterium]|nr:oxidoreductase [Bacillota bacterium]